MSRKKMKIWPGITDDEIRKEIYRYVHYNLRSDVRYEKRKPKPTYTYAGLIISPAPYDC